MTTVPPQSGTDLRSPGIFPSSVDEKDTRANALPSGSFGLTAPPQRAEKVANNVEGNGPDYVGRALAALKGTGPIGVGLKDSSARRHEFVTECIGRMSPQQFNTFANAVDKDNNIRSEAAAAAKEALPHLSACDGPTKKMIASGLSRILTPTNVTDRETKIAGNAKFLASVSGDLKSAFSVVESGI